MDNKVNTCCLCGKEFYGWGNNPYPLNDDEDARCCDDCNFEKVIPARLKGMNKKEYRFNYVDKNGKKINDGDFIKFSLDGKKEKVYLTENNELGTDATNPIWLENGRACPCEYGIYPFEGTQLQGKFWVDCEIVSEI